MIGAHCERYPGFGKTSGTANSFTFSSTSPGPNFFLLLTNTNSTIVRKMFLNTKATVNDRHLPRASRYTPILYIKILFQIISSYIWLTFLNLSFWYVYIWYLYNTIDPDTVLILILFHTHLHTQGPGFGKQSWKFGTTWPEGKQGRFWAQTNVSWNTIRIPEPSSSSITPTETQWW